jgi:hypothetical protein
MHMFNVILLLLPAVRSLSVCSSYSAYQVLFSGDWRLQNLTAAFDYMAKRSWCSCCPMCLLLTLARAHDVAVASCCCMLQLLCL